MEEILKKYGVGRAAVIAFDKLTILPTRSAARIPAGCRRAVMTTFPYYSPRAFRGNVSGYCAVADYHRVIGERLKSMAAELSENYPGRSFVPFVDASPVAEVDACRKARLGVKGKNGLLITPEWGSFVFIGEILTDREEIAKKEGVLFGKKAEEGGKCRRCGRCALACPGGAIREDGFDKNRCASFISQKKGELSREEKEILKKSGLVFGCDICQKVCPENKKAMENRDKCANLFSDDVVNFITKETAPLLYKDRAFGFRGLPVLLRNLDILYGETGEDRQKDKKR